MSIESVDIIASQKTKIAKNNKQQVIFKANSNNTLERNPQNDIVEKKGMSTGAKIALGSVAVAGAFALFDAIACKGKHIRKIFGGNKQITKEQLVDDIKKRVDDIIDKGDEVSTGEVTHYVAERARSINDVQSAVLIRLNKDGLQGLYKNKMLPEELLGRKDGILVQFLGKDGKLLENEKGRAFIANKLDDELLTDYFSKNETFAEISFTP